MRIELRALEPSDIDCIYAWENDSSLWPYGLTHSPFSRRALQTYIDECDGVDIYASRQLRLMGMDPGLTVGCADLFDFDPHHHRAGVGLLVDSRLRGRGYGSALVEAVACFAAEHLQLHQLYCHTAASNRPCIGAFAHAGFHQVAELKDWLWAPDGWENAVMMCKLLTAQGDN